MVQLVVMFVACCHKVLVCPTTQDTPSCVQYAKNNRLAQKRGQQVDE